MHRATKKWFEEMRSILTHPSGAACPGQNQNGIATSDQQMVFKI